MSPTESKRARPQTTAFWRHPSTLLTTSLRVALIILPRLGPKGGLFQEWLSSPAFKAVLIKPSYDMEHVREAIAIQRLMTGRFADAYSAHSRIRLPPLLLAALTPLAHHPNGDLYLSILCLLFDLIIASTLEAIGNLVLFTNRAESVQKETQDQELLHQSIQPPNAHIFPVHSSITTITNPTTESVYPEAQISMSSLPSLAAKIYYWSPFTALGAAYACYQQIPALCLTMSLWEALRPRGSPTLSTFYLALAAYLELHYAVFLVSLIFLPCQNKPRRALLLGGSFLVWFTSLQVLSFQLVGANQFSQVLYETYGVTFHRPTQSLSVHWYLAMQLFSRFRDYFASLLGKLPYILVAPLTIRLYKYPIVLVAILSMVWNVFRPVQTLFDSNFSFCFFVLCPRSLARMDQISFLALCSMGVPVVMNVIDHWMWLGPNTGNANYLYFQCLAYNAFLGIIVGQFCSASLQRDKALRLTLKERATSTSDEK